MLRLTQTALMRSYFKKVKFAPVNHARPRWLPPRRPHRGTPSANKIDPEDIKNVEDQRRGLDWYKRIKKRGEYRHWPFVKTRDDGLRRHKDPDDAPSRSFSVKDAKCKAGTPLYDYYANTHRDYQIHPSCPPAHMAECIALFTAKVWSKAEVSAYLTNIFEKSNFKSIEEIAKSPGQLARWNKTSAAVPSGLLAHAILCAKDIVRYNTLRDFRIQKQKEGILRTRTMERYFALPYLHKGANAEVPKKQQPLGVYPEGEYYTMREKKKYYHPLHAHWASFF